VPERDLHRCGARGSLIVMSAAPVQS